MKGFYHGISREDFKAIVRADAEDAPDGALLVGRSINYTTSSLRRSHRIAARNGDCPVDNRVITASDVKQCVSDLRVIIGLPPEISDIVSGYAEPVRKWRWIREPTPGVNTRTLAQWLTFQKSIKRHQVYRFG